MLNNINALELNENELMNTAGGNWLTDAWDSVTDACSNAWDATCDFCAEHKKEIIGAAILTAGVLAFGVGSAAIMGCAGAVALCGGSTASYLVWAAGGTAMLVGGDVLVMK
ncbi:MAG: hypothetical protein CW338_02125 [Clostridiales bacterium]|nr:hypothetical protein [Clostridiales bacterium]